MPAPSSEAGGYHKQEHTSLKEASLNAPHPEHANTAEASSSSPQGAPPVPTLPTLPVPHQDPPQNTAVQDPASDTPMLAADDEVIEKAWVDKAKKIVAQTKNDPYAQEKEVSRLQADYLKKRYGKEIKLKPDA